ncbi:MAG: MBL fold metallo-hydrolase [Bacteroidales bacterium]|nr:MBL fold metallo-hydrolase [Bacteroidales bacterium]
MTENSAQLVMLGTGNAAVTKCFNTCFVIKNKENIVLIDAGGGNGILTQLEKANINLSDIHNMFVTHAHTDHILGVVWIVRMVVQSTQKGKYQGVLNIYSHEKVISVVRQICGLTLPKKIVDLIDKVINFVELKDGDSFMLANMKGVCFDIQSTKEKQFGFKIQLSDNKTLVCLGDEPYNEINKHYVENADWLLSEAFCLYSQKDVFKPYEKHHSTALDAGVMADNLNVKNLVLYHTEDKSLDKRKESYTKEAAENFKGNVFVPDDLETILL